MAHKPNRWYSRSPGPGAAPPAPGWTPLLDPLIFSGTWVALAAAALTAACTLSLGNSPTWRLLGVVFSGTLVIYNIDHLRDLRRDSRTAPARTAFVRRHRRALTLLTLLAALLAVLSAALLNPIASASLAPILALGLLHRRLKRRRAVKVVYTAVAWIGVTVLFPSLIGPQHHQWPRIALGIGLALLANSLVSSAKARRHSRPARSAFPPGVLPGGRALAAAGALLLAFGGNTAAPRPLAAVPLATLLALLRPQRSERYLLTVVDGALLAGSLLALGIHAIS